MKRILAILLCTVLTVNPAASGYTAYAAETVPETVVDAAAPLADAGSSGIVGGADADGNKETETAAGAGKTEPASREEYTEETQETGISGTDAETSYDTDGIRTADGDTDDGIPGAYDTEDTEDTGDTLSADVIILTEAAAQTAEETVSEDVIELQALSASSCFEVKSDGTLALKEGRSLTADVIIPASANRIPRGIFNGNTSCSIVRFESDSILTAIEDGAFQSSRITSISIPEGVTSIGNNTFKSCTSLESITFNGTITSIGSYAFYDTRIMSVELPAAETIGDYAFGYCSSLKTLSGGRSLTSIGKGAFTGCTGLSQFAFGSNVTSIGEDAFRNAGLTSIDLSFAASLTSIGESCFRTDTYLRSVILPDELLSIPENAFLGCSSLTYLQVGGSTEKVMSNAFDGCSSLKSVILPGVYQIDDCAFSGCTALKTITMKYRDSENIKIDVTAFPDITGVTMRGYDGAVRRYAANKGYTYESLGNHDVKYEIDAKSKKAATVKLSSTSASEGTTVRVTVTPASGYELSEISVRSDTAVPIVQSEDSAGRDLIFDFVMPSDAVTVYLKLDQTAVKVTNADIIFKTEAGSGYYNPTYSSGAGYYEIDTPGRVSKIAVRNNGLETDSWLWNFSSSNTSVATVSSTGVIRTTGVGKAVITATLKSSSKTKATVTVNVKEDAKITGITLYKPSQTADRVVKEETINGETVYVVRYEKAIVDQAAQSFDVSFLANTSDDADSSRIASSDWVSSDKSIATVAKAKSNSNSNTITVKKGASGEAQITVSVLNKGEKTASDGNTARIIIRVVDGMPRLGSSNITVNSTSFRGTLLDISEVYGYSIVGNYIGLYTAKDSTKLCNELSVQYDDDEERYYICSAGDPFSKVYSGKTQLYLGFRLQNEENTLTGRYYIPITKLTVTDKALNPTLKTSGKINLFYSLGGSYEDPGSITVTQSLKDTEIEAVSLIPVSSYAADVTEAQTAFASNFDVSTDGTTITVKRSDAELQSVKNKAVLSGYIYITYKGYLPIRKQIIVPTCNTAPEYVLDTASATASTYASGQVYSLTLVDKKTKKIPLSLSDIDTETKDADTGKIKSLHLLDKSAGIFKAIDAGDAKEKNAIQLEVNGNPGAGGKAFIELQLPNWSKPLTYTFTLKTTNRLPSVKLDQTKLTLDKSYPSLTQTIKATDDQSEATLEGFDVVYTGNRKYNESAEALIETMTIEDDAVTMKLPEDAEDISNIAYSFRAVPKISYDNGETTKDAGAVTFSVTVKKTVPAIRLSNATFRLNANYPGMETVSRKYTISNLMAGSEPEIDTSGITKEKTGNTPDFDEIATIAIDNGTAEVSLKSDADLDLYKGKTLSYTIKGLKVKSGTDEVTAADLPIKLQLHTADPAVKVTSKGTLNPIDASSKITFTAAVSNIESGIESVKVEEYNAANELYCKDGEYYSPNFEYISDASATTVGYLKLGSGSAVAAGKSYRIRLVYTLGAAPGDTFTYEYKVTPKQTLPQITVDKTSASVYAGQNDRTVKVNISLKNKAVEAVMENPEFAAGISDAIKKAFDIDEDAFDFDEDTKKGTMTLKLVDPSVLTQNKTYTLKFATKYKNQLSGSTGNTFTLKLTLRK